jgi:hypothetical protein
MKINLLIFTTLLLLVNISCHQERDLVPGKGEVKFSLIKSASIGGKTSEALVPTAILLSIVDDQNVIIKQNKKILLYPFGQDYISESLQILVGNYQLTQFLVLDASNKIIYAAPTENSELASNVNDPLPINFSITEDENILMSPQVLPVIENENPEKFGYMSFGLDVVTVTNDPSKVKGWYRYQFQTECQCITPNGKVILFYNANGKLSSYDVYGYPSNGFQHNWHSVIEYFSDGLSYRNTTWHVNPATLQSIREIYFNYDSRISLEKLYGETNNLIAEYIYSYSPTGFTMNAKVYNSQGAISSTWKTENSTDENNNVTKTKTFGAQNILIDEVNYTFGSKVNPLADFNPLFIDSQSRFNVLKKTIVNSSYEENYYYTYSTDGYITEKITTASNGTKGKDIYRYY